MGKLVAGDEESYRYLVESIREFPKPERFSAMIEKAGFGQVSATPFSGGIVHLHTAYKI